MLFLNKFLTSSKLKNDLNIEYNDNLGIKPISISNLSLIKPMKEKILSIREKNCSINIQRSYKKLSLIVPYRLREAHLKKFIPYIKSYLENQNIDHEIIIVEQNDSNLFNRAKLMNIGAINSSVDTEYFIFHDVDLLPENIDYRYCNHSLKLFNMIDNRVFDPNIFGGVTLVPKTIFYDINGFSNNYWQWGKEDDDFLMRHLLKGYIPLMDINGRFNSLPHPPSLTRDAEGRYHKNNKKALKLNQKAYQQNRRYFSKFKRGLSKINDDGLSGLQDYKIDSIKQKDGIKTIKCRFEI